MAINGNSDGQPASDVYTALLAISTIFVGAAVIFICVKSQQLFGSWLPFS